MNIVAKVGEITHVGSPKTDPNALEYLVGHELLLDHTGKVLLQLAPSNIKHIVKDQHDLVITFQNGETFRIINFYMDGQPDSELYLLDDDGTVLHAVMTPGSDGVMDVQYVPVDEESDDKGGLGLFALGLLGLGGLAGGLAAALDDDDDKGSDNHRDITPPNAPSISSVEDNVGSKQDALQSGDSTDDQQPTFNGSNATPGDTITLYDGDAAVGSAVVDANGNWTITPTEPLAEGEHDLSVTATDKAGNESDHTPFILTVDTTPPAAPELVAVTDDVGAITGLLESGDSTDDAQPEFRGSGATPGDTITLYDGDNVIGSDVVGSDGNWIITPTDPLTDGTHNFTLKATDPAGNESSGTSFTLTVDTTPPAAPELVAITDDVGAIIGLLNSGDSTDDNQPEFRGSGATPGDTITLYDGDNVIGSAVVDANGNWSITPTNPLTDGSHDFSLTATDPVGNESERTAVQFTIDTQAPTLTIAASDQNLASGEATTITFQFSEAVSGFAAGDVTVTGGSLGAFTQVDADTWTATFTQDGSATAPSVSVADGTFTDAVGNPGIGDTLNGADGGLVADITPPTLAIRAADLNLSSGESTTITFQFSEAVSGFAAGDVSVAGGSLSAFTQVDAGTWTATFTQDGSATAPSVSVADGAFTDVAGNPGIGDTLDGTDGFAADIIAPTLAISAADLNLASGESTTITFQFSEAVSGFAAGDVTVAGGNLSAFTQVDADTWTAIFTQDGSAIPSSISVADGAFTDVAGNPGIGDTLDGTDGFAADIVAPTLAISAADLNLASGESTTITFQFSEAVSGFAVGDVSVAGGSLSGFAQVDTDTWTATFTQDGSATAPSVSVANGAFTDLAGNPGIGDELNGADGFNSDIVAPTLAISAADLNLASGEATTITFQFSEAVSGFAAGDVTVAGGSLSAFTKVDADTWTASFTQDGSATPPSVSVANGTFTDLAGNPGIGDTLDGADGFNSDIVSPTLAISAADLNLASGEATTITFQFSEAVSGFVEGDVSVAGGSLSAFTQVDADTWTATFTQDGSATAPSISVANGTFTDLAGNLGIGDELNGADGFTSDIVAPTLAISAADLNLASGESTTITFQFSEAVNGFAAGDVTVAGGSLSAFTQVDADTWTATFTQDGSATAPSVSVANGAFTDLAGNLGIGDELNGADGFNSDIVAPTLAISAADLNLASGEATTITFQFSEAVNGFAAGDVTVAGGSLSAFTQVDADTWTATFTQDGTATAPSVSVANGAFTDVAGNLGIGDTLDGADGFGADITSPTLAISAADLNLASGEATTITFQFSEAVSGFVAADVTVAGGSLSAFTQVDADTWTATFTQDGTATAPSVSVANGAFTDVAGNLGIGDTLNGADGFNADIVAPIVVLNDLVTADPTPELTGTIDDPTATIVVTVDGVDYTATNNGDGTWTLPNGTLPALTGGVDTPVTVVATDPAGNTGNDTATVTWDDTGLTVSISALTTNDATPPLSGLVSDPAATVTVRVGATDYAATNNGDGTWTLADNTVAAMAEGNTTVTVTASNGVDPDISDSAIVRVDLTPPTLVISAADLNLSSGEATTITFQFSEAVSGFAAGDVSVAGGSLSAFTQVDADTWTATFTQSGATAPSVSVGNGTFTDQVGNAGVGDTLDGTDGFGADITPPTLAINAADLNLASGESTTITFQFSETVSGFAVGDITVAGGSLSGFAQVDADTWTATFTQSGATAPSISVADGTFTDLVGNLGIGDTLDGTGGFNSDITPPTLVISAADLNLASGEATTITFQFSEAVSGFAVGDVTVAGGSLSGFAQVDADTWTATFTQDGSATAPSISVANGTFTDLAGNLGIGDKLDGTDGFTSDIVAPTLAISAADLNLASGESTVITFQFSEAVSGFAVGDITLAGGSLSAFTQVDADTWTATFTQDGSATAPSISVANGTFTDLAGNLGIGDKLDGTDGFTSDIVAPTLAISAADLNLASGESTTITFQFSEAVSGFAAGDVTVAGGSLSAFTQVDADTWTATFTQSGATAPSISVANGTFTDLAGNLGIGDELNGADGFTSDIVAPTLAISAADLNLAGGEATTITFQFSEAVSGFVVGDVTVVGGSLSVFTQVDADTWTATFTRGALGTAPSISVANGTFTDLAGNPGIGDTLDGADGFTSLIAENDTADVNEDATVSAVAPGVLGNEVNSSGDALSVSAIRTGSEPVTNGTAGTVGNALVGQYGTLTLNANGSYSYTADQAAADALATGETATDVFTYTVTDSHSNTDTAELRISVNGLNDAPIASATSSDNLLGLIGVNAADLIDLSTNQALATFDPDNNLTSVTITWTAPVVSVFTGTAPFTLSDTLKTELGFVFGTPVKTGAWVTVLGVTTAALGATYSIEITKSGGGAFDNQSINELLGTFTLNSGVISLGVLNTTEFSVQDASAATDSASAATLLDANILGASNTPTEGADNLSGSSSGNTINALGGDDIVLGNAGNDTIHGNDGNDRIYGNQDNDTLYGDAGNDLIRGGAGNDTLNGDAGNDLLIDGSGSDTINGGEGNDFIVISGTSFVSIDGGSDAGGGDIDILALDDGISLNTSTMTGTISNIERVDMSYDSAANTLTLNADTVRAMTDAGNELQIVGDSNDTLNVSGFAATGTATIVDGVIFNQYQSTSGALATLLVDEDVTVNVV